MLSVHKSDFPAVLNRYSMNYTVLLILVALNLGFLWRGSVRGEPYKPLLRRLASGPLVSLLLVAISGLFLIDFVMGVRLPRTPGEWVNLLLIVVLLIQIEAVRAQPILMSSRLALVSCSLVVAVIVVELIFVGFVLESRNPANEQDFLRLMMTPSHEPEWNAAWPRPIALRKAPGAFRILGLADSFGIAGGGTHNYHYVLEDLLRRDGWRMIEMVNVSVGGYDLLHELSMLRFGMAYSPDVVLHGLYVGNDFWLVGEEQYAYRNIFATVRRDSFRYRPRRFLIREWIGSGLQFVQDQRRMHWEQRVGIVDRVGLRSKGGLLRTELERMNALAGRNERNVEDVKKNFAVLDVIRSGVEKSGARYVMVIHPYRSQVDDELRQEVVASFQVSDEEYELDLPQKLLGSYCRERVIPCLDLLPVFRGKAGEGALYLPRDEHYNHRGNEVAAASIREFLEDRALLPRRGETVSSLLGQRGSDRAQVP